jgi:hypothetical protein
MALHPRIIRHAQAICAARAFQVYSPARRIIMKTRIPLYALPALFFCSMAFADAPQGSIAILEPADGAVVSISEPVTIKWQAVWGPDGNHLHIYMDSRMMEIERMASGSDTIRILLRGKHQICLAIETGWHFPTGVRKCIEVTAK